LKKYKWRGKSRDKSGKTGKSLEEKKDDLMRARPLLSSSVDVDQTPINKQTIK
jgi:hypothetical protein